MKFGYLPEGMRFIKVSIDTRNAIFEYTYKDNAIYLVQTKEETEASKCYISDGLESGTIKNKWIGKEFNLKEEKISEEETKYDACIIIDGIYYNLLGIMDKEEFRTNFDQVTEAEVAQAAEWMNNYPRRILGWRSAGAVFEEYVAA